MLLDFISIMGFMFLLGFGAGFAFCLWGYRRGLGQ